MTGDGKQVKPSGAGGSSPTLRSSSDAISAFVETARTLQAEAPSGRLIFALDATMSRQPTWDRATRLQAEMFEEAGRVGGLAVQLVFFRGIGECKASGFVRDAGRLAEMMMRIECRGGRTQIGKVLSHAARASRSEKVAAVVYVGDCMEESVDDLAARAGELGLTGTKVFLFQEGGDPAASRAFAEIARLTGGAHLRFDGASVGELAALLRAAAAYATGGVAALTRLAAANAGAKALLGAIGPQR